MPSFGRRKNPVLDAKKADQAVVRALGDALPDHWTRAELVVEVPPGTGKLSMRYTILSSEGHALTAPPPQAFFVAIQAALQAHLDAGKRPTRLTYFLQRQPDRSWTFHTQLVT